MEMKLKIIDAKHQLKAASTAGSNISLLYAAPYEEGDIICLETDAVDCLCEIQLDEAMLPAVVFLQKPAVYIQIPFGEKRAALSPKAFCGNRHLLTARFLRPDEITVRRNLARNPYSGFTSPGLFPCATANVETRDEAVFAARNAIDGIYANLAHGAWPYGSWGINRQKDACWTLNFGRAVQADLLCITLRCDFPHDNYWEEAVVEFSDGSSERLTFTRTPEPQIFSIEPRRITGLTLKNLIPSSCSLSPFPALTQFEVWGSDQELSLSPVSKEEN